MRASRRLALCRLAAHRSAARHQIRYLREQLDAERKARTEERRRHDTIVAQLTSRIPAIEAPEETPSEGSEAAEAVEQQGRGQPHSATVEDQESVQRPWWRRVFGA